MSTKNLISVVVPIYNEEEAIANFLNKKLFPELTQISAYEFEILLINDGSTDKTLSLLQNYAEKSKSTKVISFSRNFGKEVALAAGLKYAQGAAVLTIDSDGQQPPNLIPEFIEKWEQGAEIVTGVRDHYTKHGLVAKLGSKLFYYLLRKMGNRTTVPGSTDFRLIDRVVVDEYNHLTEHGRITRGLIDWLGFRQAYVHYIYKERLGGRPSYDFKKLMGLALDSFVSMSTTPLMIIGYVGAIVMIGSFLLGVFCIVNQYLLGDPLHLYWNGAVQMSIFIAFLVGLVLVAQAIIALYISHIHAETQNRPLFIVDKKSSRNI